MRKIVILNGIADEGLAEYEAGLTEAIAARGDELSVQSFCLRDMDIRYCTGCWDCWVKTPGVCMHKDDMPDIYRAIIASDLFLYLSPMKLGFINALTKKTCDRLIPLVHPYLELVDGEIHHRKRYEKYPEMGFILIEPEKSDLDYANIHEIFRRLSINLRTTLTVTERTGTTREEAIHAISTL